MRFNPRVAATSAILFVSYAAVALAQQTRPTVPTIDVGAFVRPVVARAAAPAARENVKDQVLRYGVGAKLEVKLISGKNAEGSVASIQDHGFEFGDKRGGPTRMITYNSVRELRPVALVYRANGIPDAAEARRVVRGLGTGHHIQVRTTANRNLIHGNIQSIGTSSFTMVPDRTSTPIEIAFADTHYVEQNLSKGAKSIIATVVGVILVAVLSGLANES